VKKPIRGARRTGNFRGYRIGPTIWAGKLAAVVKNLRAAVPHSSPMIRKRREAAGGKNIRVYEPDLEISSQPQSGVSKHSPAQALSSGLRASHVFARALGSIQGRLN